MWRTWLSAAHARCRDPSHHLQSRMGPEPAENRERQQSSGAEELNAEMRYWEGQRGPRPAAPGLWHEGPSPLQSPHLSPLCSLGPHC